MVTWGLLHTLGATALPVQAAVAASAAEAARTAAAVLRPQAEADGRRRERWMEHAAGRAARKEARRLQHIAYAHGQTDVDADPNADSGDDWEDEEGGGGAGEGGAGGGNGGDGDEGKKKKRGGGKKKKGRRKD